VGSVVSDAELIQRTGDGDRSAFEVLYRRHARSVFGLALQRLGDSGRAEDAVQDTFASVWRSARTYSPERAPGAAWLFAVAKNAIVDRGRAAGEPAVAEKGDVPSLEAGPDVQAEHLWAGSRIHKAVEMLPEPQRDVIVLMYWNGLSQSEVARLAGVPLGTVKTRARSALRRLAELLEEVV